MKIDTDAWFAVLAAARAHDRPDGPALERAAETGRLRIPALHSRAVPVTLPAPEGATGYRAVKLRMLEYLRAQRPGVREIETTVADENTPMRAVNAALGYRAERNLGLYQVRL
ncbi:hypothetical protein HEP86_25705 [Streptomyces sp. RPA4-5]|uniref:hypothetical protein n=1 Tax=Streptomyces sp. RPA4-5 TaxID=2721245 RepID=UPI00143EF349|nr:hypothetical protein [Streptomyces sp. RPA4-5]QIY57297.1 hypothetical protein HEP86_25705 [Streptomyces sp. RPA4-5]